MRGKRNQSPGARTLEIERLTQLIAQADQTIANLQAAMLAKTDQLDAQHWADVGELEAAQIALTSAKAQIDACAATQSATATAMAACQSAISALGEANTAEEARLVTLETHYATDHAAIATANANIATNAAAIATVSGNLASLASTVASINSTLTALAATVAAIVIPSASSVLPAAPTTTGSIGVATPYARADHAHPKQPANVVLLNAAVTLAESSLLTLALSVRRVSVAVTGAVAGKRYVAFPNAALPTGYSLQDCYCTTNGTIVFGLLVPILGVGSSYSISVSVLELVP